MPRHDEEQMSATVANALIVDSPLSLVQLEIAYLHYKNVADLLMYSGPRFVEAREEAKRLGNIALMRLRGERAREEAQRRKIEADDGLKEIL